MAETALPVSVMIKRVSVMRRMECVSVTHEESLVINVISEYLSFMFK